MDSVTAPPLDDLDQALLNQLQRRVPLDHRPFSVLGERLGISEQECLDRVGRLKAAGMISRLSTVFDGRALGYRSLLVAMRLPAARIEQAVSRLRTYPGLFRCERRDDAFGLWLTIAVAPTESLDRLTRILHTMATAEETILLPSLKAYKVPQDPWTDRPNYPTGERIPLGAAPLNDQDVRWIRTLQEDLPLMELPYAVWAEQAESTEETLFAWMRKFENHGAMETICAMSPRPAGAMQALAAWDIPGELLDSLAEQVALFRDVERCDRRPTYPSWPFALVANLQATTDHGCRELAKRIAERVGPFPGRLLMRSQTYLLEAPKYFLPTLDQWWIRVAQSIEDRVGPTGPTTQRSTA